MKGKIVYEAPRFMTVSVALFQLLEIMRTKNCDDLVNENSLCVGLARIGSETQLIKSGSILEISQVDFGEPLHSLIIPGKLHPLEKEMLDILENK